MDWRRKMNCSCQYNAALEHNRHLEKMIIEQAKELNDLMETIVESSTTDVIDKLHDNMMELVTSSVWNAG